MSHQLGSEAFDQLVAHTQQHGVQQSQQNQQNQQSPGTPAGGNGGGSGGGKGSGQKPTYAKRGKITIVACVPCRKRKTKCDGKRPHCSQCTARDGPCNYDMTDDQRKLTYLRDRVEQLSNKSEALTSLLNTVQTSSEAEAAEIFRRIRQPGTDIQYVAEQIQAGQQLFGIGRRPSGQQGQPRSDDKIKARQYDELMNMLLSADTDAVHNIIQQARTGEAATALSHAAMGLQPARSTQPLPLLGPSPDVSRSLEAAFSRHDQTFGMVKGAEMSHTSLGQGTEFIDSHIQHPWTSVTRDDELIEHLLTLYFTWQHCFFQNFPEQLFREDMQANRTKYCSTMLVNAILAAGCFLSNREICRQDHGNGKTLMDLFYDEATKQLEDPEVLSTVTTTAALYLISYVDGTRGRLSALWQYSGRSVLMAVDLELHLRPTKKRRAAGAVTEEEEEEANKEGQARSHAFWGCFHVDQTTSFTLGRLPLLNINGITCEPPDAADIEDMSDDAPWSAYEMDIPDRPGVRATTFSRCAALSKLINSTLVMFFAPVVPMSGALLLAEYEKYLDWYRTLPAKVANTRNAVPHVISLHMYYHTAVLLLFRPFLKATIDYSDVVPRDVCREAANMISDLWQEHHSMYGLSGIYMFQVHCLLTACTLHIINVPTISANRHLTQACNIFQELIPRNEWARSSLVVLRGLAEKWRLVLPLEVEEAMYRDIGGPGNPQTHHGSMLPDDTLPEIAPNYPTGPDPMAAHAIVSSNIDFRLQQHNQRMFLQSHPEYAQQATEEPNNNTSAKRSAPDQFQEAQKRQRLLDPALRDQGLPMQEQGGMQFPTGQSAEQQMPQPRQAQMVPQQQGANSGNGNGNFAQVGMHTFGTGFGMGLGGYTQRVQQAQRQNRSASNFIYSPLANHPAPILMPVARTASSSDFSTTPASGVPGNSNNNEADQQQTGIDTNPGNLNADSNNMGVKVEGLSFDDDWRVPFIGDFE